MREWWEVMVQWLGFGMVDVLGWCETQPKPERKP